MNTKDQQAGFDKPRPAKDRFAQSLYRKYQLGESPSLANIEPVASKLLADPLTFEEGASLVMGRSLSIGAEGSDSMDLIVILAVPPEIRFGMMLPILGAEEERIRQRGY